MKAKDYMKKIQLIHKSLLDFLDCQKNLESDFQVLVNIIFDPQISNDKDKVKEILHLIAKISSNHYRSPEFFTKIEQILQNFRNQIKQYFTDFDLFNIFQMNKRLLLFLIKEQMIILTQSIYLIMTDKKHSKMDYSSYFSIEFEKFNKVKPSIENNKLFEERRLIGENENYICQLIRNDSINDFIVYINKNNISLSSKITKSIFETNPLLCETNPTLIEYAAFFGSIQVFQYLQLNGVSLNSSLWIYAVHGKNPEIFHILERNCEKNSDTYKICFKEAIKCHHNDFAEYIQNNFLKHKSKPENLLINLKYHNFTNLPIDLYKKSDIFYYLCNYDYPHIVKILLNENKKIDVNSIQKRTIYDKKDGYEVLFSQQINGLRKQCQREDTPLNIAAKKGNKEIVEFLLSQNTINTNINTNDKYDFYVNDEHQCLSDEEEKTTLYIAVEKNNFEIVQLLLKHDDSQINLKSKVSIYKKAEGILKTENTPLLIAIENDNPEIIEYLLNQTNINVTISQNSISGFNCFTQKVPLHIAIEKNNAKLVQLLLSKYSDHNFLYTSYMRVRVHGSKSYNKDVKVMTPLQMAVEQKNIEIVKILLENEKNINYLELERPNLCLNMKNKKSALHIAVENECSEIVQLLVKQKDININSIAVHKNEEHKIEKTALFIAVEKQNIKIIKILLDHENIDVYIKLSNQNSSTFIKQITVLDIVASTGNQEIIDIFKEYQVLPNGL